MTLSAFDDKSREPQPREVAAVLGTTAVLWDELIANIASRFDPLAKDWGFSGKKWGWSLRLRHRKRAVLYMTPLHGHFRVGFALGPRAVEAAHRSDLPPSILETIDTAQQYVEGRAVRIEVRTAEDVRSVTRVAELKMGS